MYVVSVKRFIDKANGVMFDKEQFTDVFGQVIIGGKPVSAASHFLHGGRGQKLTRITFRPGQPQIISEAGVLAFNAYRPPIVTPTHGSVAPWLELGEHVVPDAAAREHHLRFFAHLLQSPDIKINHGLLLTSPIQGVGKDSWFAPIVRILGHLAQSITPIDLANQFNDYLYERQLIVVEELAEFGQNLANKLKPILACPPDTLRINRKGVPQFDVPNVVHCFMMSNFEEPVRIEPSDRRFHVYQTPATPKPNEYYDGYYKWLAGHLGDVYGFLLRYDLADFNPYAPPPMTAAKQILIAASEPVLDQHLKSIIETLPDLVTLDQIRRELPPRLKDTSPHRLARVLKALGARPLERRIRVPQRVHVWAIRNFDAYAHFGEAALKTKYEALQSEHFWAAPQATAAPKPFIRPVKK